jgi:phosphatidate phosphatase APP1
MRSLAPVCLPLVIALVPSAARGETPALLLPASLGRPDRVWIAGRVLNEAQGEEGPVVARNLRQLAASNRVGAAVEVTFLGRTAQTMSGHDGEFEVSIAAAPGAPFPPGAQPLSVAAGGAKAQGVVHVVPESAPFLLVSDFDDTVAVTRVKSARGLVTAALFEDGDTQPAVPGMDALYRCLAGRAPLLFVSGSPIQFAPRIARFLEKNAFPPAALYLRNLGFKTLSGYKEPVLRLLAERFSQPFVLVGDSGEKDPEIYAAFAKQHPGRVMRIYVRRAGDPGPAARYSDALLFSDPAEAIRDAAARSLCAP